MRPSPKYVSALLMILVAAAVLSAGDKPWMSKPYSQWTDKDVQLIMTDSPWVQSTTIRRSWVPGKEVGPEAQISGGVRPMPGATGGLGTNSAGDRESEASTSELKVYIYWDSSRVMRAASARQRALRGELPASEVEPYARVPQQEYVLVLSMGDMTPFVKSDEKFFQSAASLETKRGHGTVRPSHVVYQRDSKGTLAQALFFFPKTNSSGAPTIRADETEVQFRCKIADSDVRVNFKVGKMVDPSGPDL